MVDISAAEKQPICTTALSLRASPMPTRAVWAKRARASVSRTSLWRMKASRLAALSA